MTHGPFTKGVRTFAQLSFVEAVLQLLVAFSIFNPTEAQHVAILAVLTPIATYLQNAGEKAEPPPAVRIEQPEDDPVPTTPAEPTEGRSSRRARRTGVET